MEWHTNRYLQFLEEREVERAEEEAFQQEENQALHQREEQLDVIFADKPIDLLIGPIIPNININQH